MFIKMRCLNKDSKFKGRLNLAMDIWFNLHPDSDNINFPINTSVFELLEDGWIVLEKQSRDCSSVG